MTVAGREEREDREEARTDLILMIRQSRTCRWFSFVMMCIKAIKQSRLVRSRGSFTNVSLRASCTHIRHISKVRQHTDFGWSAPELLRRGER